MHTDVADVGYGGTLNVKDLGDGIGGFWSYKGVWNWKYRASSITLKEPKEIRMLLMGGLGTEVQRKNTTDLLLHVDNQGVVHIWNSFVSAGRPMMRKLHRLKLVLDLLGVRMK